MTVIEVRGRGGQLIERFRSAAATIRVGRAFDNDLVLEDEYVSPYHLELSRSEAGFRVRDLASLNGLHFLDRASADGELVSGGAFRIGHTTLRIFDAQHPTAPALPFDFNEERLARLGRHAVWVGLAALAALVTLTTMFWSTSEEFHPGTALAPIAMELVVAAGVAAVWALLGRLLRHRAYFLAQLSLWIALAPGWWFAGLVARSAAYNASSQSVERALESLLSLLLLGATLWASLTLATPLRGHRLRLAALGVAAGVVGLQLATQVQFQHEFRPFPEYYARIQSPAALWAAARAERELPQLLEPLFERASEEASEPDP